MSEEKPLVLDSEKVPYFKAVGGANKVIVDAETMTMDMGYLEPGQIIPEHSHPPEQIGYALEGECELEIDGVTYLLRPGYTWHIPSESRHEWRNVSDERFYYIDAFSPRREDLRSGTMDIETWKKHGQEESESKDS